jgi:hypothetical protein
MRCAECGADLPGEETCLDRFHAVLEVDYLGIPEAFAAHGLVVFTYHAQHPSRAKPWTRVAHWEGMREIFGRGRDWRVVLAGNRRPGVVDRSKAADGARETPVVGKPVAGELTIAGIDPAIPPGHVARVEAWARSVAEHRFLDR